MAFDPAFLTRATLATSLAGALVLTATLSAPAYAEGDDAAGELATPWSPPAGAATEAAADRDRGHAAAPAPERDDRAAARPR